MPYIKQDARDSLGMTCQRPPSTAGELNYLITVLAQKFIADHGGNYEAYNAAIGALECAKLELYRRRVCPYEDSKIAENGDV